MRSRGGGGGARRRWDGPQAASPAGRLFAEALEPSPGFKGRAVGILFRPKEVVGRDAAANRIGVSFAAARPTLGDLRRSEDEIMRDSIAETATSRRERRLRET